MAPQSIPLIIMEMLICLQKIIWDGLTCIALHCIPGRYMVWTDLNACLKKESGGGKGREGERVSFLGECVQVSTHELYCYEDGRLKGRMCIV